MPEINYIQVLKDAWKITWKNKFLWWLGLLSGSAGMGINFPTNSWGNRNEEINPEDFDKVKEFISAHLELLIYIAIGLIILMIIMLAIGIIARGGLIKSIHKISKGEPASFRTGFREGKFYFWRIMAIGLSCFLFVFLTFLVISVPIIILFSDRAFVPAILLLIIGIIVFFAIAIILSFMKNFGNLYAVIGNLSFRSSLEKAYELFKNNLLASIVMALIFIPINLVITFGLLILFIPIIVVFILIGLILYYALAKIGIIIAVSLGGLFIIAISLFVGSIYQTFSQTVWILFFYEIARTKVAEEVTEKSREKSETIGEPNPIKTTQSNK